MAGGGIKISNIKVNGGADGATFVPEIDQQGNLSWSNNKGYTNPQTVNIKGPKGENGKDGVDGAKLLSQELIGQDEQGGNIYKQTFSDGTEAYFTAPKGQDANPAEKGTTVTVGGVEQTTWNADTKLDKAKNVSAVYDRVYAIRKGSGEQKMLDVSDDVTVHSIAQRTGRGQLLVNTPDNNPWHATNKRYVDDGLSGKLDKATFEEKTADIYVKTSSNTAKIENLTNILLDNEQMAIAEVSQAFTTRQTADGENIIDNQNIFPKKIAGSTQNCYSLVDFSSAKTTGGLTVTANNNTLTISGTTTYNYAVVFMLDITDLLEDGKTYNLYQSLPFTSIFSSGAFYMQVNATNASTSAITSIFSANSTGKNSFICDKTTYSSYVLSLQSGVVDSVGTINSTISFMFYEGTDEKPYQPYFKGLKNAYFEKVVSTGRNLIDFITPFAASSHTLTKPFSLAEGTYTLQVICDDYDGQKNNVVTSDFLDENYNSVLPLNNGSNNGINSWSTFSITAEEAARTRYISVYMNSETGADLIGKIIKLMLNHGTEALPYEPYTESELGFTLDEARPILKEWDYILPQEQKIVRQTRRVEFTGTESFILAHIADSDGSDSIFAYKTGVTSITANKNEIISNKYVTVTDGTSRFFMDDGYIVQGGSGGELEYIYIRDDRFSTVDEWKAYLAEQYAAGDAVIVEYKLAEATEENIVIPNNYTAYQGGLEKVVQGNTDNSEYGAMCTLTNDYFVKVGGATNEQTE